MPTAQVLQHKGKFEGYKTCKPNDKKIKFFLDKQALVLYNNFRCQVSENFILRNGVTVARQTLTLFVGVQIPIPQP